MEVIYDILKCDGSRGEVKLHTSDPPLTQINISGQGQLFINTDIVFPGIAAYPKTTSLNNVTKKCGSSWLLAASALI